MIHWVRWQWCTTSISIPMCNPLMNWRWGYGLDMIGWGWIWMDSEFMMHCIRYITTVQSDFTNYGPSFCRSFEAWVVPSTSRCNCPSSANSPTAPCRSSWRTISMWCLPSRSWRRFLTKGEGRGWGRSAGSVVEVWAFFQKRMGIEDFGNIYRWRLSDYQLSMNIEHTFAKYEFL